MVYRLLHSNWGYALQSLTRKVHRKTRPHPTLPWIGAIGLAIAVGIAYFFAAQLSLALLAETDGVAVFWPAAGVSSGVLIALGRDARLPVAGSIPVGPLLIGLAEALREPPQRNKIIEGVVALVALATMTVIIVSLPSEPWKKTMVPIALLFPIMLWITARCQPACAAAAAF